MTHLGSASPLFPTPGLCQRLQPGGCPAAVLPVPADAGRHSRLGLKCGCIREALKITSPELPYSVCGMAAPRCQAGNTRGLAFQLGEGKTLQQNFCAA